MAARQYSRTCADDDGTPFPERRCNLFQGSCEWDVRCRRKTPRRIAADRGGVFHDERVPGRTCVPLFPNDASEGYVCYEDEEEEAVEGGAGAGAAAAAACIINVATMEPFRHDDRMVAFTIDGHRHCHELGALYDFWSHRANRVVRWHRNPLSAQMHESGTGSRPEPRSPICFKEPITGMWIRGRVHVHIRMNEPGPGEVLTIELVSDGYRRRVGNLDGNPGMSLNHGQLPGEVILDNPAIEAPDPIHRIVYDVDGTPIPTAASQDPVLQAVEQDVGVVDSDSESDAEIYDDLADMSPNLAQTITWIRDNMADGDGHQYNTDQLEALDGVVFDDHILVVVDAAMVGSGPEVVYASTGPYETYDMMSSPGSIDFYLEDHDNVLAMFHDTLPEDLATAIEDGDANNDAIREFLVQQDGEQWAHLIGRVNAADDDLLFAVKIDSYQHGGRYASLALPLGRAGWVVQLDNLGMTVYLGM